MSDLKTICIKCNTPKTGNEFGNRSGSSGHRKNRWCKTCCADYRESSRASHKRRRTENIRFILEFLSAHPCVDCKETDLLILQFDHVDPSEKRDVMGMLALSREKIEIEIAKCVVRCANCHARRTAQQFNTTRFKLVQEILAGITTPYTPPRRYKKV